MSDVSYTDDGRPAITVRPHVRDLVTKDDAVAINPLEFLYGSPQAAGERTTRGPGGALRDILQSAGRNATDFFTGLATAPYRAIQAGTQRTLGEPLSSDDSGLDAASTAAQLAVGGGMPFAVRGALGSSGGRLMATPPKVGPFYSAVEHAIAEAPQAKMTLEQWRGYLRNQPGVKAEELDFMGLGDSALHPAEWKAGQPVTREQMLEHAEGHGARIKEIEKKGAVEDDFVTDERHDAAVEHLRSEFDRLHPETQTMSRAARERKFEEFGESDAGRDIFDAYLHNEFTQGGSATKFHEYQLPGGDNYRELLLTLPEKKNPLSGDDQSFLAYARDQRGRNRQLTAAESAKEDELLRKSVAHYRQEPYRSSHWDEPNVLVHLRMNDRLFPNDLKSLHLEEVQSDWHQQGRKKGYQATPEQRKIVSDKIMNEELLTPEERAVAGTDRDLVPDAPFKSTWADLALKRAITKAADEGYDAVSWTPGAQQAERYDLSKHIDDLKWYKDGDGYRISAKKNDNIVLQKTSLSPQALADTVGKDIAEKITKSDEQHGVMSGLDLKVGGEGMVKFYDKMLVDKANALGKKFGAKVEWRALPGNEPTVTKVDMARVGEPKWATPELAKEWAGSDSVGVYLGDKHINNWTPKEAAAYTAKHNREFGDKYRVSYPEDHMGRKDAVFKTEKEVQDYVKSHEVKVPVLRLNDKLRDAASRKGMPLFSAGIPFKFTPVDHDPFAEDN